MQINPYTGKPGKMMKINTFVWPEEKAKLFTEAKKPQYSGIASAVIRDLIKTKIK